RSVAQLDRDRGDAENNFDELKNQWGWAGFTTQDRKRCQIMGRIIALVYNRWTIFMRLGIPDKHAEAITSRPLALHGIARQTRHGNQTTVEITSTHAKASQIAEILTKVSGFLRREGHRKHWSARRRHRLTAVFRIMDHVQEFQSPHIRSEGMIVFALLLLTAVSLVTQADRFEALLVLVWGFLALRSARHIPFFAIAAAPVVASAAAAYWARLAARAGTRAPLRIFWDLAREFGRRPRASVWLPRSEEHT